MYIYGILYLHTYSYCKSIPLLQEYVKLIDQFVQRHCISEKATLSM